MCPLHADVCPDDHDTHHRRHPISNDDHAADLDTFDGHAHDTDEPADVTVSDLLDLRDVIIDGAANRWSDDAAQPHWAALWDAKQRADDDVRDSYFRIAAALDAYGPLSPEERAEFDRRTA